MSSASHNNTALIISNNEIEDIIKIVKSLQDSGLSIKGIQAYDSIMCGYFYIGFIDFMLKGKT